MTIHSALSILISTNDNLDIEGERLKKLQNKLENMKYIIIDEKSMVRHRMLSLIDMRLRQAFPKHNNEPFGGRSIIMFGDFDQLSSVLDLSMYASSHGRSLSNDGYVVYQQFQEAYRLDAIECQSGNSEEQKSFRDILSRLHNGESTLTDWKNLISRLEDKLPRIKCDRFSEATSILTKWTDVDFVNINKLRSLNCPVAKIQAVHDEGLEAKRAESDTAKGFEAELLLAKSARIMLTVNLWMKVGLVNRSMGTV